MNELQIFNNPEFGEIRMLTADSEPWFVGKDVAAALGYSNTRDAMNKHVDDEDKGVAKCDTLGGEQEMTIINESGLYSLIFSSNLPTAKAFKRWVTHDVLPSIRKTGGYRSGQAAPSRTPAADALDDAIGVKRGILALITGITDSMATLQAIDIVERQHKIDLKEIRLLVPPAEKPAEIGLLNATNIRDKAQERGCTGISAQRVNKILESLGLQEKTVKDWRLTEKGKEYGEMVPYNNHGHSGYQAKWNMKAVDAVVAEFKKQRKDAA